MMKKIQIRHCLAGAALLLLPMATMAQTLHFSEGQLSRYAAPQSTDRWVRMQPGVRLTPADFLAQLRSELHLSPHDQFKVVRENRDELGNVHLRLQQFHNGLPVDGGVVLFHYRDGELTLMNGEWAKGLNIASFAPIGEDAARQQLGMAGPGLMAYDPTLELTQEKLNAATVRQVESVITFAPFEAGEAITWFPAQKVAFEAGGQYYTAWFHAEQGHFVKLVPQFYSCNTVTSISTPCYGSINNPVMQSDYIGGQYYLSDACRKISTYAIGTSSVPSSTSNSWNSTYADEVSAQWSASVAANYFQSNSGVTGYTNTGIPLVIISFYGSNNASYWFDETNNQSRIVLGQHPNGNRYSPPDVVGHEYTHGVINFTAGLNYEYHTEASALNESFADIFGVMTEEEATGSSNWEIGDCVFPGGVRQLNAPTVDSYESPAWYSATNAHHRSALHSFWYYLLSDGGSGTNSSPTTYTYNVSGLGKHAAAEIALRNLTVYLHPLADMQDARKGGIQAAIDLYGQCAFEVAQCTEAFDAIGVYDQFSNNCGISVCADLTEEVCGQGNGTITLNTYPAGGLTFAWSHGPTSASVSNLPAGTYTVTVTNPGTSCSYTQTYTIEPSTLDFRVSGFPSFPSNLSDHRAIDIQHDNDGNTWLLGQFQSELAWDGLMAFRIHNTNQGFYLAKYTACGEIEFLIYSEEGPLGLEIQEMAVDHNHDQVIITGYNGKSGSMTLFREDATGTHIIGNVSAQTGHGLAISISRSGQLNWSNTNLVAPGFAPGLGLLHPVAVDVDEAPASAPQGHLSAIYLAGGIDNTVSRLVRLNPLNGKSMWYTSPYSSLYSPGVFFNTLTDVEAELGNIHISGYFNSFVMLNGQTYWANSDQDGMVTQLLDQNFKTAPTPNWFTQFGSNDRASCLDLAYDHNNNVVYVTGTYREDLFLGTLAWWNSTNIAVNTLPGSSTYDHAFVWKLNADDGVFRTGVPNPGPNPQIDQTGWFYLFGSYEGGAEFTEPQVILGDTEKGVQEEVIVGGNVEVFTPMTLPAFDESYGNGRYEQLLHEPGKRYFAARFTVNYAGVSGSIHAQTSIVLPTATGNTGVIQPYLRPNFLIHADSPDNEFSGIAHADNRMYIHGDILGDFWISRLGIVHSAPGFSQAFVVRHETVDGVEYRTDESLSSELEELESGWSAFPNPATDEITVMVKDEGFEPGSVVTLSDLSGRTEIQERMTAPMHRITDLSRLSAGTYLLSLTGSGDSRSQLIVVR